MSEPSTTTRARSALSDRVGETSALRSLVDRTRGPLALTRPARPGAAAHGRNSGVRDDIKALAGPVLAPRMVLDAEAEFDGATAEGAVRAVLAEIAPPTRRGGDQQA